jgi:YspA, cpYpsA-related SLOG family
MTARILVTGSRMLNDYDLVYKTLAEIVGEYGPDAVVVHGAAQGADRLADRAARQLGMRTEPHPARWRTEGKAAGIIRNQRMVNLGADLCVGFPLGASTGTRDCLSRAASAGIPCRIIEIGAPA